MQDLEIEGKCVLSGIFMTLFGVCMAIVLLIAIGFAIDEFDRVCCPSLTGKIFGAENQ